MDFDQYLRSCTYLFSISKLIIMDNLITGFRHSDFVHDRSYDRFEDSEVKMKTCHECGGSKRIYYSDCCGADVIDGICQDLDCLKHCAELYDPCRNCDDNGEVEE